MPESNNTPSGRIYTAAEAMKVMRVSRATYYSEVNDGRLRTYKVGRRRFTTQRAIDQWVSERENAA